MEQETKIFCPECGHPLDVNSILKKQLQEEISRKYNTQLDEEKKRYEEQAIILSKEKELLDEEKLHIEQQISDGVKFKIKAEKELIEKQLRASIEEEESDKYTALQKELEEKSTKLKEFNKAMADIERLKREKNELKESIEAEAMKTLNETLVEEKEKIRKAEQDKNEMALRELQKKLDDQKRLTEEMQRKQEQGSMQLQGEVQELAIEEWLKTNFPLDSITEIKKGVSGGDCIQVVNTHTRVNCGTIYYESKRAKNFAGDWIEKFKTDMRAKGITVGILVTQVYPKGMDRMGLAEGIWICNYDEFKGLSAVIRETAIKINEAIASQENKGSKMEMLYDYLTSPVFHIQVEAIVEGFTQLKADMDAERAAMQRIWKSREMKLEKVLINTTAMYGSVKGIGGNAIATVQALELGAGIEDEVEISQSDTI